MRLPLLLVILGSLAFPVGGFGQNVIVIFVDDLGWPDLGIQGAADLLTPTIDDLASRGVRFTAGYVAAPLCSPSRAALMTGRYAQRFGYDMNPGPALEEDEAFGLPLTESTLGNRMKALGYATAWIGKSHLGGHPSYHPLNRGFDYFYGFLEGHHSYCLNGGCPDSMHDPIQEDGMPIVETEYLTTAIGRHIVQFINEHATEPFCVYAPFNGVHEPLQVTSDLLDRTASLFPGQLLSDRHKLAGMLLGIDDAVQDIILALQGHGLEEETLIIFTSDNGAPPPDRFDANGSINDPFSGYKSAVDEGGIRVPFFMYWKDTLAPRVLDAPVSTLDILPTCVAAAGGSLPAAWGLDGVNLLPYALGQTTAEPHASLYWRINTAAVGETQPGPRAVRQGPWKLIKRSYYDNWALYNVVNDEPELINLADDRPDKVAELLGLFNEWERGLMDPRWDFSTLETPKPLLVLEDVRLGSTTSSYLGPEFLKDSSSVTFQDENGTLWLGEWDRFTGLLVSQDGRDLEIDLGLSDSDLDNEGPQWGLSATGAFLYYTKPGTASRKQLWRASTLGPAVTQLTDNASQDSVGPRVSQEATDASVKVVFQRAASLLVADEAAPSMTTAPPDQASVLQNGRWIPGTDDLVYVRTAASPPGPTQLARFHTANGTADMLTDDGGNKTDAWGFIAPEFGNELCFAAIVDRQALAIYRDRHRSDGIYDRVATLTLPAALAARYLYFLKPLQGLRGFNGVSYFSCAAYQHNDPTAPGESAIWLLGLGTDEAHRLPGAINLAALCATPRSVSLLLSDPSASGVVFEPETAVGEREVFAYHSRRNGAEPTQLRLTKTGLTLPDYSAQPSGFAKLEVTNDYEAGTTDSTGQRLGGTEVRSLVSHEGKLYAGVSSYGNEPSAPLQDDWTGAQILVKDSTTDLWRLDHSASLTDLFRGHRGVELLTEVTFSKAGTTDMDPKTLLLASLSDIAAPGAATVSARTRVGEGLWAHSGVATTSGPAFVTSFAVHTDGDLNNDGNADSGAQGIFAGLSNGEIYRGVYNDSETSKLTWLPAAELSELTLKLGPVTSLTEADGVLYAACGMRQDSASDPVTGGLYRRDDHTDTWVRVYAWPTPLPLHMAPVEERVMTALTAVDDPLGCGHQVLIAARSWPGVIERIDPTRDHAVSVEVDVRDFFARRWDDPALRETDFRIGYTNFTPVMDPVTGDLSHLLGIWVGSNASSNFLVRHADGTYEAAAIEGVNLGASRCFATSPFLQDAQRVLYAGGYDTANVSAVDTAWILRAEWNAWPSLDFTYTASPSYELAWPPTSLDWILETSPSLGAAEDWQWVPELPTRSVWGNAVELRSNAVRAFYRLHKP